MPRRAFTAQHFAIIAAFGFLVAIGGNAVWGTYSGKHDLALPIFLLGALLIAGTGGALCGLGVSGVIERRHRQPRPLRDRG